MQSLVNVLGSASTLNTVLLLLALIGGFFAFRNGKRTELVKLQRETIEALQQRTTSLEQKIGDLEKENHLQQHIIDTIISALKTRGMAVTIDGDMVTIADESGASSHKKLTTTKTVAVVKREEL